MEAPIILIIFNRPDLTKIVFDALRKLKPSKLYISADGPRDEKERINCEKAREIVKEIDWECEIYYRFLDENLGCGIAVSSSISWAFEKEDRLIIFEDDLIPTASFINFCNYNLEKYKDEKIVMQIAGNNYTEDHNFTSSDYFFSRFGHISGWATWKRAWDHFDYQMTEWPSFRDSNNIFGIFDNINSATYFTNLFNDYYGDPIKPWAARWLFAKIRKKGLSIVPRVNLVKNIGAIGTYSTTEFKFVTQEDFRIKTEPTSISCNELYDDYHFRHYINKRINLFERISAKIKRTVHHLLYG